MFIRFPAYYHRLFYVTVCEFFRSLRLHVTLGTHRSFRGFSVALLALIAGALWRYRHFPNDLMGTMPVVLSPHGA